MTARPQKRDSETDLGPPNSASGGRHHAEVRATRNRYVKPPNQGVARRAQHFNHSTGTTLHQSWERASKQGTLWRRDRRALNLPIDERAQGGDQWPNASITRVRASKSETWVLVLWCGGTV